MSKDVRQHQHIKVLYVEDDPFTREKLLRVLNRRFRNVLVAIEGEEGYQLFKKYHPDIVITDLKMHQMNGLEMIRKIRDENDKVQLIVTTAHDENDIFIQSIENNINHFILKPIDLDRFLLSIQKSVNFIQLEKERTKQKYVTRLILDHIEHLIFVVENGQIVEFNQAFTAFTGISKSDTFPKATELKSFFVEDPHYFYPIVQEDWIPELVALKQDSIKIRWIGQGGMEAIFMVKTTSLPIENQKLFIFTDITSLETECRKNERYGIMDPLENIYNRIKFDEILTSELKQINPCQSPFSLILFDIDHFFQVNDQYNYQVGDEALVTISTIVQQCIREFDILARWEGDAFILFAPQTDVNGAKELAESIRTLIESFDFQTIGHLTCSFGISGSSNNILSKKELLTQANQAMLESKNQGRNCVTIYQDPK